MRTTGFTYIELLFAMSLIAIVLLGSAQIYLRLQYQQKVFEQELLLTNKLHQLIDYSYAEAGLDIFSAAHWNSNQMITAKDCRQESCDQQDYRNYSISQFQASIIETNHCSFELISDTTSFLEITCPDWQKQFLVTGL